MKVGQGRVDRFEDFFGCDLARLALVGTRGSVHAGDAVVLVAVVPGLNRPPSEAVLVSLFVQKRHLGDVLNSLVPCFTGCDLNRSEDFHFDVDRWPFHGPHSAGLVTGLTRNRWLGSIRRRV